MPKSFKKKKYNARFPPARIKKIMQTDEEVGKVAAAVPVIISRALEMFIESLITDTAKLTQAKNAKTLSTSHIKQTIKNTKQFDFLLDLVKNVPDHQAEDNNGDFIDGESSVRKGKGRPRKIDAPTYPKKRKSGGNMTSSDEDDEDDEDEDDTEATETDEESNTAAPSLPPDSSTSRSTKLLPGIKAASSNQAHSPLQPSMSEMAINHNNNNYVTTVAGSPLQHMALLGNSSISGKPIPQVLHNESLPLSSNCVPPILQITPPLQQMPPNFNISSSFSPYMPPKIPFYSNVNVTHPSSTVIQTSCEQQPIDLTNPLRQNCVNEDDDYDT